MLELENEALRGELLALRRFIDSLQNLSDATETPRRNDQIMDLLEDVLDQARQAINAKDGSLLVLDEDTDELVFVITKGDIPSEDLIWRRIPQGEGVAGWVVREQRPTIVNNPQADDRFWDTLDGELGFSTDSILAAPILGGGRVLGVVEVLNKHDGLQFSAQDQALLGLTCRFAGELLFNLVRARPLAEEAR
jgi:GAF domain-containing protein